MGLLAVDLEDEPLKSWLEDTKTEAGVSIPTDHKKTDITLMWCVY